MQKLKNEFLLQNIVQIDFEYELILKSFYFCNWSMKILNPKIMPTSRACGARDMGPINAFVPGIKESNFVECFR